MADGTEKNINSYSPQNGVIVEGSVTTKNGTSEIENLESTLTSGASLMAVFFNNTEPEKSDKGTLVAETTDDSGNTTKITSTLEALGDGKFKETITEVVTDSEGSIISSSEKQNIVSQSKQH